MMNFFAILRCVALSLCILVVGCTPGAGPFANVGGAAMVTIDMNLAAHAATALPQGDAGGYAPLLTTVPLGTTIRFVNSDNANHTATIFAGNAFPSGSPFSTSAQSSFGTLVSSFSSGTLTPGTGSQTLTADRSGTFLYGCFYHYGAPMRGVIVVQ